MDVVHSATPTGARAAPTAAGWRWTLTLVAALLAAPASAGHLLITEVGYDPLDETGTTAEFVEIFNPGPGAVALGDFWLADDEEAYPLIVNGPVASGITLQDFVYRFPAVTLPAGGLAVVCHDSDAFLAAHFPGGSMATFFAQPGDQILLEITSDGTADSVPAMLDYGSNPAATLSMANNGECIGLVTWNGVSDLVVDHDWVCWLTLTYIPNKDVDYPLGIDGPDPGLNESWFAEDLGTATEAPDAAEGSSIHRTSSAEPGEAASGGNGVGGHDETSEDWSSWVVAPFSPGVTALAVVGVADEPAPSLSRPTLTAAGPNPFRDRIEWRLWLPRAGRVTVEVLDLNGRRAATLLEGDLGAGPHSLRWDGKDRRGHAAPSGLYFVRMSFEGQERTQRVARLR